MLGVPSQDISEDLYTPKPKQKEPARSPELEELFRLAEELRRFYEPGATLQEVEGKLTVVPASAPKGSAETIIQDNQKSPQMWPVVVVVAALVLPAIGWKFRKDPSREGTRVSRYKPATAEEAHRFLSHHSVDPLLYVENRPFKRIKIEKAPDLKLEDAPSQVQASVAPQKTYNIPDRSFSPMPVPLSGQLESLPDPSSVTIVKQTVDPQADVSLHDLEAELRGEIRDRGGKIKRVSEEPNANSKIFYVAVASGASHNFAEQMKELNGSSVSVLELGPDELGSSGSMPSQAEISAAETNVATLKKQLDQGEISFYPEAPALSGLRAQYSDAIKKLASMRRLNASDAIVRIELMLK